MEAWEQAVARTPGTASRGVAARSGVIYCQGEQSKVGRISLGLFGRRLRAREYAALAGACEDAETLVGALDGGLYLEMRERRATGCLAVTLVRLVRGRLVVVNDGFRIQRRSWRRQGFGLRVFARQLCEAKRVGACRIDATAGRCPAENGYYTWPRFGFDAPLPAAIRIAVPPDLGRPQRLLELMECRAGRAWWLKHGTTIDVSFDLAEHSRSWRAFQGYWREKQSRFQTARASDSCPAGGQRVRRPDVGLETASL